MNFDKKTKKSIRKLRKYVKTHIYKGKLTVASIQDGKAITNLNGDHVYTNKMYDKDTQEIKLWIQGVRVYKFDISTNNNLLHLIDESIVISKTPVIDYLRLSGMHQIVYKMLKRNHIYFQFPFGTTLLAPLDHAFDYLPQKYRKELITNQWKARVSFKCLFLIIFDIFIGIKYTVYFW